MEQQGVHVTIAGERDLLLGLVEELNAQFKGQDRLAMVVDWGWSVKKQMGYVELVWMGEVDAAFEKQLEGDHRVEDFCVYTIPTPVDDVLTL